MLEDATITIAQLRDELSDAYWHVRHLRWKWGALALAPSSRARPSPDSLLLLPSSL
jgi:hypothetical protein